MPTRRSDTRTLAKVSDRLAALGRDLAAAIGPHETAVSLIAAGGNLLVREHGRAHAVRTLRRLATELERHHGD